jgi:hypothetical protein
MLLRPSSGMHIFCVHKRSMIVLTFDLPVVPYFLPGDLTGWRDGGKDIIFSPR